MRDTARTAAAPAGGQVDPLGRSPASHFKGSVMLKEAELHARWSEGVTGQRSPSFVCSKLLQEDRKSYLSLSLLKIPQGRLGASVG